MYLIESFGIALCILLAGFVVSLVTPPDQRPEGAPAPRGWEGRAMPVAVGAVCLAVFGVAIGAMIGSNIEPLVFAAAPLVALVATIIALQEAWFGVGASPSAVRRGLVFSVTSLVVSVVAVVALFGIVFATCSALAIT